MAGAGAAAYVGRFAPSPTGDLHFGSLIAAVGSYLEARSRNGHWLVRIEDLDPPRTVPGAAEAQLAELRRFGFQWDGEVLYQNTRSAAYAQALAQLEEAGWLFPCACTRSELRPGEPYAGTCRQGLPPGREGRALRVRVHDTPVTFDDRLQGPQTETLSQSCGDFVVRRADGLTAYQLAVVVDDAFQGVTDVVRGSDLLDSTARQRYLQSLLGLPKTGYLHLPLVKDPEGRKLGKRYASDPLSQQEPRGALGAALRFLGHAPPPHKTLAQRWQWAQKNWRSERIPRQGGDIVIAH